MLQITKNLNSRVSHNDHLEGVDNMLHVKENVQVTSKDLVQEVVELEQYYREMSEKLEQVVMKKANDQLIPDVKGAFKDVGLILADIDFKYVDAKCSNLNLRVRTPLDWDYYDKEGMEQKVIMVIETSDLTEMGHKVRFNLN